MAKPKHKPKHGILDKVLHPGGHPEENEVEAGDQGEGFEFDAQAEVEESPKSEPAGDKHQHKKFDKFKRGT